MKSLIMVYCLCWLPSIHAETPAADKPAQSESTTQAVTPAKAKKGGMSVFWIVFVIAILFVISSATALNRLGGKPPKHGDNKARPRNKSGTDEHRFRL